MLLNSILTERLFLPSCMDVRMSCSSKASPMPGSHTWRQLVITANSPSTLSPAPRSFFRSSIRLPDWQSSSAGQVATRVRVGLWDCKYSKVDWESLQATRCAHAHPNVCMRRLRTVVRRPNLDHQTQLAVGRASQHASRSPADSTVLLPRRGPFGWHTCVCHLPVVQANQVCSIWR